MRAQAKRVRHEEEEESAFVSMTDMTVGFLFIMMILLAFFASQVGEKETVPRSDFVAMMAQRDDWRKKAESRSTEIIRLEAELQKAEEQVKDLIENLARMTEDRDALRVKVATLSTRNDLLSQQVNEQEILIKELRAKIFEKDREIERLREKLSRLKQVDPLEAYLANVTKARGDILNRLKAAIKRDFPLLKFDVSIEDGSLRFQGEGLFAIGSSDLTSEKAKVVSKLAERLNDILPCYTLGPASRFDVNCNPAFAMVEAVQIEGHTDDSGADQTNRTLSAERANSTFFAMTNAAEGIMEQQNLKKQPVLSVAAYGPDRPVASNQTEKGRATNRRIDLRFIMVTPRGTGEIELIRDAFLGLGETTP